MLVAYKKNLVKNLNQADRVETRLLRKDETSLYQDHLLRLDLKSREQRFDHSISDKALEAHCRSLQKYGTRIVGAFVNGVMRGGCEISRPLNKRRNKRELAFSVETEFQFLGLGSMMMQRSLRLVRPGKLIMYCQISNLAMIALAEKFNAQIAIKQDYVVCKIPSRRVKTPSVLRYDQKLEMTNLSDLVSMNPCF